jgi:DNA-directed RNA polymerase subunit K/omega
MPVESPSPSAVDSSLQHVLDSDPTNDRNGARPRFTAAARALADALAFHDEADRPDVEGPRPAQTTPIARSLVIRRPAGIGAFEFVTLSKLRAAQLMRGCRPRLDAEHKATVIAQLEVSEGKVRQVITAPDSKSEPTPIGALSEDAPAPVYTV